MKLEHLAIGENVQSGNVVFGNEKTKNVLFNVSFENKPSIDLTLEAISQAPPFKINITNIGFTIKFPIPYNGIVEWKAIKK